MFCSVGVERSASDAVTLRGASQKELLASAAVLDKIRIRRVDAVEFAKHVLRDEAAEVLGADEDAVTVEEDGADFRRRGGVGGCGCCCDRGMVPVRWSP